MLKPGSDADDGDEALRHYANHTAQIEVLYMLLTGTTEPTGFIVPSRP